MNIEPQHLQYVKDILSKYPYTFYVFGSRLTGKVKPLSDLDLCFFDHIEPREFLKIKEEFEESNLPYKVDLVDGQRCSAEFREIITQNMEILDTK